MILLQGGLRLARHLSRIKAMYVQDSILADARRRPGPGAFAGLTLRIRSARDRPEKPTE
jgi:hypothetical protein